MARQSRIIINNANYDCDDNKQQQCRLITINPQVLKSFIKYHTFYSKLFQFIVEIEVTN